MFNGYLAEMKEDQLRRGVDVDMMDGQELANHMRAMGLALITEAAEVVESFQWKPWKHSAEPGLPREWEDTADEICDVLHFLAHLANIAGITDDLLNDAMVRTREKNRRRVEMGSEYTYGQA